MTRTGPAWLTIVAAACLSAACSGSTSRDINFGTDAGAGFEAPIEEVTPDTGGAAGAAGAGGAAGSAGATGAAGSAGAGDGGDASDAVSDGDSG